MQVGAVGSACGREARPRQSKKGRFASIAPSAPPTPSKNLSLIGSDK
nr:hypothetical protein [uncultured Campylobacter sp.]